MTREETKKILMVVQAAYPNFNPPDKTVTVDTWHHFLGDYTYAEAEAAVGAYIRSDTSGFAPGIGKMIEKLVELFEPDSINEMAAWGMVLKAMGNSGHHAEEEFARLPETVQKAVGSPSQLREWGLYGKVDGTWMSVTQSNFIRAYKAEVAREREMRKLGPDNLRFAGNVDGRMELPGNGPAKSTAAEERRMAEEKRAPYSSRIENMINDLRARLIGT